MTPAHSIGTIMKKVWAQCSDCWLLRFPHGLAIGNERLGEDNLAVFVQWLLATVDGDGAGASQSGAGRKIGCRTPGGLPVEMAYAPIIVAMDLAHCCHLVHPLHLAPILTHERDKATGWRKNSAWMLAKTCLMIAVTATRGSRYGRLPGEAASRCE
jgi:hypothetical protein